MTDIVELAARVMEKRGYEVTRHDLWLEDLDSGFVIKPELCKSRSSEGRVRSMSAITTSHPQLVPKGVFEYQHSSGDTLDDALSNGFDEWAQLDFVVFLDSLREKSRQCQAFDLTFQQADGPGLHRRALLGPVGYKSLAALLREEGEGDAEHPFCSCCFFTNTLQTFAPLLEVDVFYAIRMFAARDENGKARADCRVNGGDWEPGQQALIAYADTWPPIGLEQRKQYVILQTRAHGPA